jgi:hypothetical protein
MYDLYFSMLTLALGCSVNPASATYSVWLAIQVLVRASTTQGASQAHDAPNSSDPDSSTACRVGARDQKSAAA